MRRHDLNVWKSVRFPCLVVERVFGKGNFDDAGDAIINALRGISERPIEYPFRFEFDSSHANPWFHVMIFEVKGIAEPAWSHFIGQIIEIGLLEDITAI